LITDYYYIITAIDTLILHYTLLLQYYAIIIDYITYTHYIDIAIAFESLHTLIMPLLPILLIAIIDYCIYTDYFIRYTSNYYVVILIPLLQQPAAQ